MKAVQFGPGRWWRVETVLRRRGPLTEVTDAALVDMVCRLAADITDGPDVGSEPAVAYSYDAPPPDGSVGVGLWVQAATAGAAIDGALETVDAACVQLVGDRCALEQLWDVRAVPADAVLPSPRTLRR